MCWVTQQLWKVLMLISKRCLLVISKDTEICIFPFFNGPQVIWNLWDAMAATCVHLHTGQKNCHRWQWRKKEEELGGPGNCSIASVTALLLVMSHPANLAGTSQPPTCVTVCKPLSVWQIKSKLKLKFVLSFVNFLKSFWCHTRPTWLAPPSPQQTPV